ncbi:hypothetical protein KAW18_01785 [candidate division WOR-3 bacterium]|nr:hypothetical protein [candidate division WOR-3 bacterium]
MIKKYLRQTYVMMNKDPFYEWVLEKGKLFRGLKRQPYKELIEKYRHGTKSKQCYYNSQMMALNSDGKISYYEGWYVTDGFSFPFDHGFNVYNGKVIDTTAYGKMGVREYFGVKIPIKFVRESVLKTGMAEAILYRYYRSKHPKKVRKKSTKK